jgi:hypothetical protein
MSDLSPLCVSKRVSADGRVYEPSPTRTASWQLSMRGFEGLDSSCGRFAPNPSHCAAAATKQPGGQIFAFAVGQITFRTRAILSRRKGRWPSSSNVGMGCGGRGGVGREVCSQGGFRERATERRTYDAEAYGEVVWS